MGPAFAPQLDTLEAVVRTYLAKSLGDEIRLASSPATRAEAVAMISSPHSAPYVAAVTQAFASFGKSLSGWSDEWTAKGERAMSDTIVIVLASGGVSLLLALLMGWAITRAIGRPLGALTGVLRDLATGHHAVVIPALAQKDEMGEMARAIEVLKDGAIAKLRLEGRGRPGPAGCRGRERP